MYMVATFSLSAKLPNYIAHLSTQTRYCYMYYRALKINESRFINTMMLDHNVASR